MLYKTADISRIFEISSPTVRVWVTEFGEFFSETGNPEPGQVRRFTEEDIRVFRTIKTLRDRNQSYDDIREVLSRGEFIEVLPEEGGSAETAGSPSSGTPETALKSSGSAETGLTVPEVFERIETLYRESLKPYEQTVSRLEERVSKLEGREGELTEKLGEEQTRRVETEKQLHSAETEVRSVRATNRTLFYLLGGVLILVLGVIVLLGILLL